MRARTLGIVVVAAFVGGCGGDDGGDNGNGAEREPKGNTGTAPQRVEMSEFSFSPEKVRVKRGDGILAVNVGSSPHNLTIERSKGRELAATKDISADAMERLPVDVEPGDYTLVCTVPGHREAGMVGKIAVE